MFYHLSQSYGDAWRIAVPNLIGYEYSHIYRALRDNCMWGNTDKTLEIDGIKCISYEFENWNVVVRVITLIGEK